MKGLCHVCLEDFLCKANKDISAELTTNNYIHSYLQWLVKLDIVWISGVHSAWYLLFQQNEHLPPKRQMQSQHTLCLQVVSSVKHKIKAYKQASCKLKAQGCSQFCRNVTIIVYNSKIKHKSCTPKKTQGSLHVWGKRTQGSLCAWGRRTQGSLHV